MDIKILLTTALFFSIQANADQDITNPNQKAILNKVDNICNAELVGQNYKIMQPLVGTPAAAPNYILKNSLAECVQDGGRVDPKYEALFPELSLMQAELFKQKEESNLQTLRSNPASTSSEIQKQLKIAQFAQEQVETKQEEVDKIEAKNQKKSEDIKNFYGFNWAPGIAVMNYRDPYIDDIRIETSGEGTEQVNTVYIDREVTTNLAIVLETHYLWPLDVKVADRSTGIGLFAAINLAKQEGDPLSTFAFGPIFAVKDKDSSNAFAVGLGYFVDTDFKELRDGVTDGSITNFTDSSKLIRKVDASGWLLMISSKF